MTDWPPPTAVIRLHISSFSLSCRSAMHHVYGPGLHYNCSLFLSFDLSGFLFAGDIKHFRIGGGVAPGGGNILNIFSSYTHLLVLLDKLLKIS